MVFRTAMSLSSSTHLSFLCLQGRATCKMSAAFSIDRVSIFPPSRFFHQFLLFLSVSMWLTG